MYWQLCGYLSFINEVWGLGPVFPRLSLITHWKLFQTEASEKEIEGYQSTSP